LLASKDAVGEPEVAFFAWVEAFGGLEEQFRQPEGWEKRAVADAANHGLSVA
jgi:hypothetical protein